MKNLLKQFTDVAIKSKNYTQKEYSSFQSIPGLAGKLFDEAPASVIVLDSKGKILAVNKRFRQYTSRQSDSMIGRSLLARREIRDPELSLKYRHLLKKGEPFYNHVFRHFAERQNRWYTMSLSAVPVKNKQGKVVRAISIAQDITDLDNIQKELVETNKKLTERLDVRTLELLQKKQQLEHLLQSQQRFFADASHELRTPLTIIKGNLDLINLESSKWPLPAGLENKLNNMNEELKHIMELLEDITVLNHFDGLDTSSGQFEELRLDVLAKQEVKGFYLLAKDKKIRLTCKTQPVLKRVNRKNFSKVLRNLVSNAIRYTSAGGRVTVVLAVKKGEIILKVSDTGVGISPEDLPHVFDRFYRTDKARARTEGGSGLGLAICKHIVERCGGKISAQSQPGKGSVFVVNLPI